MSRVLDMRPRRHPVLDGWRRYLGFAVAVMTVPLARHARLRCLRVRPLWVSRIGPVGRVILVPRRPSGMTVVLVRVPAIVTAAVVATTVDQTEVAGDH